MALPLGKLTIIIGAGIVGSVLAKEGSIPTFSDVFSGAFKVFWKKIKHDDSTATSSKPKLRNDSLMQQVNSLRQELQLLASNRSVTIVTSSGSGSSRYGIIVVVIGVGYGYIWWKGWKLPDMMFASRRGLSDACTAVTKQLENVYSSIAATKRHLSSRIDRVDCNLDECADLTAATREEVSELRGEVKVTCVDVQSVHHAVRNLETKIHRIEGKQDITNEGVKRLLYSAWSLENNRTTERIQAAPSSSSRPALEMPPTTPLLMNEPVSPTASVELPSPSASNGTNKRPLHSAVSTPGLKELHGILEIDAPASPDVSTGINVSGGTNNGNSGSRIFGRTISGISTSFLNRTRSAMQSFK